jgi:SAM-dependent methyltransferase
MINQLVRYLPVLDRLRRSPRGKILEIGSGSQGIGVYLKSPYCGVDIDFKDYLENRQPLNPRMNPVVADACRLPFRDKAFEFTVCMDMLEHVGEAFRGEVVDEILRVTSAIAVIGCPCGEKALEADRRLMEHYLLRRMDPPGWLSEHLRNGFPGEKFFREILSGRGVDFEISDNETLEFHYWLSLAETTPIAAVFLSFFDRLFAMLVRRERGLAVEMKMLSFLNASEGYRKIAIVKTSATAERIPCVRG